MKYDNQLHSGACLIIFLRWSELCIPFELTPLGPSPAPNNNKFSPTVTILLRKQEIIKRTNFLQLVLLTSIIVSEIHVSQPTLNSLLVFSHFLSSQNSYEAPFLFSQNSKVIPLHFGSEFLSNLILYSLPDICKFFFTDIRH